MSSRTYSPGRRWPGLRGLWIGAASVLVLLGACAGRGQEAAGTPPQATVLTNINQIWEISRDDRMVSHPIQTEFIIYYFDTEWSVAFGECKGAPAFLPITDCPVALRAGERVSVDGVIEPARERFVWEKTRVQVLESGLALKPEKVRKLDVVTLRDRGHVISVQGLVDHEMDQGETHAKIDLLVGGTAATVHLLYPTNAPEAHFKEGDFIQVEGVYIPEFDRNGDVRERVLWTPSPAGIRRLGSLKTDPRFATRAVTSDDIAEDMPTNILLHVQGTVRSQELGKWITLWDARGQIMIKSPQTLPVHFGDRIEAVGMPYAVGVQKFLLDALYRPFKATNSATPDAIASVSNRPALCLAEQVRDLSREEASRHQPVELRGVVTWYHTNTTFIYVEDASGGIRVSVPRWDELATAKPGTMVTVRGVVAEGDFVPVVTNATVIRSGWWNLSEAPAITLEEAFTGVEDGRWVEMQGYVRQAKRSHGLMHLDLSTSSGEFQVWTPASQQVENLRGSVIRVRGVCTALANMRHQLTGVRLWAPLDEHIQVMERAPDDPFTAPWRSLGSLRRFNWQNELNQRVRVSGIVTMQAPGRYLYVQDGADSVFALSQQKDLLRPGDRVEVVGFPGNEGRRFLMREAVYRRVSEGSEPQATLAAAGPAIDLEPEGLLARAEGTLINSVRREGEMRLLIQSQDSIFEASLDLAAAGETNQVVALNPGSRLEVTGVYEAQTDEYGRPRGFLIHLRAWSDVQVLQYPPWWTLSRLLWALAGVLIMSVVALVWGVVIAHKNRLLRLAQSQLQQAHDRLEHRVLERTRELSEQVSAKERARAELAETQANLVLTSRRAGMAEVATGVLHNVGNVLNSVNVSAGVLNDRLRRHSVESLVRLAAMLPRKPQELVRFIAEDPKGKALPGFLDKLAAALSEDKRDLQGEVESLAKNIEHIKAIVSMQQSYARVGGVIEELDLKDLAEDALQINQAALERHHVRLIRNYHAAPHILVDRHKVLQILVNLVSNARHALDDRVSDRTLTVTIGAIQDEKVVLSVSDNGVGIAPENLSRIFSQGFTTRKDGHGFGLHSGANTAKELGGSLSVNSAGTGLGATFTLELPAARTAGFKTSRAHTTFLLKG